MERVTIEIIDQAMDELRALPSKQLQRVALQWVARLKANAQFGPELERRWGHDLRHCRKVYLDEDDTPLEHDLVPRRRSEEGARYLIVYRLLPSDERPEVAQVIAIAPKYGSAEGVYARAAKRYLLMVEAEDR